MKKIVFVTAILWSVLCLGQDPPYNSWFSDASLQATVLLEKKVGDRFIAKGTGIMIMEYSSDNGIIVSCEHVLRGDSIYVVIPTTEEFKEFILADYGLHTLQNKFEQNNILWNKGDGFIRLKVGLHEGINFQKQPDGLDIAGFKFKAISSVWLPLIEKEIKIHNLLFIPRSFIQKEKDYKLGDDCYFVGFPFGLGTSSSPVPLFKSQSPKHLVRRATIAWVSEEHNEFLIDGFSYGGNSGGPLLKVGGGEGLPDFYLIGMVIGHFSDGDGLNTGLARVLKSDQILEVVELLDK